MLSERRWTRRSSTPKKHPTPSPKRFSSPSTRRVKDGYEEPAAGYPRRAGRGDAVRRHRYSHGRGRRPGRRGVPGNGGARGGVRPVSSYGYTAGGEFDRWRGYRTLGERDASGRRDTVRRLYTPSVRPDRQRSGQILLPLQRRLELPDNHPGALRRGA